MLFLTILLRYSISNEARYVAAAQLRDRVEGLCEDASSPGVYSPAITTLNNKLEKLLKNHRKEDRLAAVNAIHYLFLGEAETMESRLRRASNAFRVLFDEDVTDMNTARAAARLAADISLVNNTSCDNEVTTLLSTVKGHVTRHHGYIRSTRTSSGGRAVSAMVLAELAKHAQNLVLRERDDLKSVLWDAVQDESRKVREEAVIALQALLETIAERAAPFVVSSYFNEILDQMLTILQSTVQTTTATRLTYSEVIHLQVETSIRVHGALIMLLSLVQSDRTRNEAVQHFSQLCRLIIPLQQCATENVREAVALVLPHLVRLGNDEFVASGFLKMVHQTTMRGAKFSGEDKGRALESLGSIANKVGKEAFAPFLGEVLRYCNEHLTNATDTQVSIPQKYIISCLMYLAHASHESRQFERIMRGGLLEKVLEAKFTLVLVRAVCAIQSAVPSLAEDIELRLIRVMATILRRGILEMSRRNPVDHERHNRTATSTGMPIASRSVCVDSETSEEVVSVYSDPIEVYSSEFLPQALPMKIMHKQDSNFAESWLGGSYGSSIENYSYSARESLHSYMGYGKTEDRHPSDVALDAALLTDKAHSPCVALRAIEIFPITKMQVGDITLFTSQFVLGCLDNENVKVRLLAVRSCANLMEAAAQSWMEILKARGHTRRLRGDIQKILLKLVSRAVTDTSPLVRKSALRALDKKLFYPYLLQPHVLRNIFICLYDENTEVRCFAVALGGRLSKENPAHVNVALRKFLEYLLGVLKTQYNGLSRLRRECTVLLQLFIREARPLVDFYSEAIMEALISRLNCARKYSDKEAAETVLKAIGDLGGISSRVNLCRYCERVVPLTVSYILDDHATDPKFCKTAIHALYKLVQCTGYVIQPYTKFARLLPGLLQLLSNESDAALRLEIETLIGCLGAVDPSNHRDAAIPSLIVSPMSQAYVGGVMASRPGWVRTKTINPSSLSASVDSSSYRINLAGTVGSFRNRDAILQLKGPTTSNPAFPETIQSPAHPIGLFGVGPERLTEIAENYKAVWDVEELEETSLVGMLEHPFTASPDFFPSIALDKVLSIIRSANRKLQHRDAFNAVVDILGSTGERIPHFLSAVFPCLLWVLRPEVTSETKPIEFSVFHEFVMGRVIDIVTLAGKHIVPFVFDTVLLIQRYIQGTRFHPKCVIAACRLLLRIQIAIGDLFHPVVATMYSSLLEAVTQDFGRNGAMAESALRVLESFGPTLDPYAGIVLQTIINVTEHAKSYSLRESALRTSISLLGKVRVEEIISLVLHPLLRILMDCRHTDVHQTHLSLSDELYDRRAFESISDGAAKAISVIAARAPYQFITFIPVVAKTLKRIPREAEQETEKYVLRKLLLELNKDLVAPILGLSDAQVTEVLATPKPQAAELLQRTNSRGSGNSVASEGLSGNYGNGDQHAALHSADEGLELNHYDMEAELLKLWRIEDHFTASDWERWRSDLECGLIKHSGSACLRACDFMFIFENYSKLARPLFNAAFLSCWTTTPEHGPGLTDTARREIVHALIRALQSPTIPIILTQSILNLFEFMEHDERPLPASIDFLAKTAFKCGAFAKALRYKEGEYAVSLRSPCSRAAQTSLTGGVGLLAIYEKLAHEESAKGTAKHYELTTGTTLNEHFDRPESLDEELDVDLGRWAAKLSEWDIPEMPQRESRQRKAVQNDKDKYETFRILRDEPVSSPHWSYLIKKLKNLNDIGDWRATNNIVKNAWAACEGYSAGRQKLAVEGKGISVAFDLSNWDEFEQRIDYLSEDPFLNAFYRTLLLVRQGKENPDLLDRAEVFLEKARRHLDVHLTARLSEGYPRAYLEVINAQTLVELEEMIKFLRTPPSMKAFAQYRLQAIWDQRLAGCKYDDYIWYRLLMIRALVLPPQESKDRWIEFSALCRKNRRLPLSSEALRMLVLPNLPSFVAQDQANVPVENMPSQILRDIPDLDIRYVVCKHLWASGRERDAFRILKDSVNEFKKAAYAWKTREPVIYYLSSGEPEAQSERKEVMVASEVLLKLAKWSIRLVRRETPDHGASEDMAIKFAKEASDMRANFFKPWHWWGLLNCERAYALMGVNSKDSNSSGASSTRPVLSSEARKHLSNAVDGFFKAIKIGGKSKLEDSLKVLTLWFKYGSVAQMHKVFDRGFEDTVITGWLEVVPQIIARLHTTNRHVQAGIEHLLTRIGNEHPQMVVYNLIVAKTTVGPHAGRKQAATRVLDAIKRKHSGIVLQAEMVARELVRVAILWGEMWYEKLDESSRLYFGERDLDAMLECLLPLHEMIDRGPETSYEKSFLDLYGKELGEAGIICNEIANQRKRNISIIELDAKASKLWEYYYYVFGRIQKQQLMMTSLDLSKVSQWLKHASSLELAVPGTYEPGVKQIITIQSFSSQLKILQSKQRPRRLAILGSDGHQYDFLLKGHEDLRQDERVMQVFGLINQILCHSQERSIRRGVDIKRYSVIALSSNAGLIEWVPNCDTMHALVKDHREVRKVMPNIEHKVMTRVAPEPDRLPLLHKVDIFKFMLGNTSGSDISRVLWLKSRSSEIWLSRRTTYARSLASSSMAGYLLGLGDRHPSNLMMDRSSGKMMHIDFGDCFEVAMVREKYPEKVPFRLTRMLVNALEPCGVDGYFRHTCEAVMRELREPNNRESLLSMMEAFVHDPLLRMKLVGGEELQRLKKEGNQVGVTAFNELLNSTAPPVLSESLQLRLLHQEGSLQAAHLLQSQQQPPVQDVPVAGAIDTGVNPRRIGELAASMVKSPSTQSRRERDRLLKKVPRDKCIQVADERAAIALQRVKDKLYGRDFGDGKERLNVEAQVDLLIREATSIENLCSLFTGWCAFW